MEICTTPRQRGFLYLFGRERNWKGKKCLLFPLSPQTVLPVSCKRLRKLTPKQGYTADGKPSGEAKLVEGHQVYRVPVQYIDDSGVDSSVSLQVFTLPTKLIPALAQLVPTGTVRMVPWVRNGRIAWSLTADGIEVLDSTTGVLDD